jgi:hypothetical protein
MRLVKISALEGHGKNIINLAFTVGIKTASLFQVRVHKADGAVEIKDIVDIQTSTPEARAFLNELLRADFYDKEEYSISLRQPASIFSQLDVGKMTKPLVAPAGDLFDCGSLAISTLASSDVY